MASTIRHKRSSTASTAPVPGDLVAGEIAVNTTDEKLYIKNTGGDVVQPGQQIEFNGQTGTSYTLALTDKGELVTMTNAAANTLTVPPNSSVAFPIGTQIVVEQGGAGTTTIAAGAGVTLNSAGSLLDLASQYSTLVLIKKATDTWLVAGDLA